MLTKLTVKLQIAEKRREVKGKTKRESYIELNAAFQGRARKDKKAFLSEQYKEIEESNRMGQTRDLFKKTKDNKGSFNAKMSTIKDRKSKDITETAEIKKR